MYRPAVETPAEKAWETQERPGYGRRIGGGSHATLPGRRLSHHSRLRWLSGGGNNGEGTSVGIAVRAQVRVTQNPRPSPRDATRDRNRRQSVFATRQPRAGEQHKTFRRTATHARAQVQPSWSSRGQPGGTPASAGTRAMASRCLSLLHIGPAPSPGSTRRTKRGNSEKTGSACGRVTHGQFKRDTHGLALGPTVSERV